MYCNNCGAYTPGVVRFCSQCGEELASPSGVLENNPKFYDSLENLDPETQEAIAKAKEKVHAAPDTSKLFLGMALSFFLGAIGLIISIVMSGNYKKNGDASSASGMIFGAAIGFIFSVALMIIGFAFILTFPAFSN